MSIACGYLTVCLPLSVVATTPRIVHINTTDFEASKSTKSGFQTKRHFFDTSKLFQAGTTQVWKWIEKTRTWVTSLATFGSSLAKKTLPTDVKSSIWKPKYAFWNSAFKSLKQKTRVYDLANAGPNKRFTVLTDAGPVLVHNCVLGLGYQMGAAKLQMTLAKGALGGPPVYFELNKCYEIVNAYRRRNHKIRDGWTKCQSIIEDMALGRTGSYKCLNWEKETIWLPNGMRLHYPDLKAGVNRETGYVEYSYAIKEGRSKIYGGLLCENLVQALARIIVFTQMLQINRRYRVVMSTHDEVVALPPSKDAQRCFDYMMKCMTTPPAWCADIPLNAEGGWARNYSK